MIPFEKASIFYIFSENHRFTYNFLMKNLPFLKSMCKKYHKTTFSHDKIQYHTQRKAYFLKSYGKSREGLAFLSLSVSYSILSKSHISHLKMDPTNPYPTLHRNGSQNLIPHSPEMDPKISYSTLQKLIRKWLRRPIFHYPNMKVHSKIFISNTFDRWVMQIPHFSLVEYENIFFW